MKKNETRPFQYVYPATDICKCNNEKCRQRFDCFRFMGAMTEWQSMSTFKGGKNCENFMPYYVWQSGNGENYMLKDIDNDYLKNIIIHLFERASVTNFNTDYAKKSIVLALEFIREARRRKIYM